MQVFAILAMSRKQGLGVFAILVLNRKLDLQVFVILAMNRKRFLRTFVFLTKNRKVQHDLTNTKFLYCFHFFNNSKSNHPYLNFTPTNANSIRFLGLTYVVCFPPGFITKYLFNTLLIVFSNVGSAMNFITKGFVRGSLK